MWYFRAGIYSRVTAEGWDSKADGRNATVEAYNGQVGADDPREQEQDEGVEGGRGNPKSPTQTIQPPPGKSLCSLNPKYENWEVKHTCDYCDVHPRVL
jgi:hypothetical protein